MGYLLPWGNMSYWGAQVIISLFERDPVRNRRAQIVEWIRGDFVVSDATLNRFFAFHVILLPLVLVGLVFLHIVALHHQNVGSNNPDGIEIKKPTRTPTANPVDGIPFHPYYTVKDAFGVMRVSSADVPRHRVLRAGVRRAGSWRRTTSLPANVLQTPPDIVPLWYFTPFYSILRAVTWSAGCPE